MILKKLKDGRYCVVAKGLSNTTKKKYKKAKKIRKGDEHCTFRDWFLVRHSSGRDTGYLQVKSISFPKELIGKRIRLIIEELNVH